MPIIEHSTYQPPFGLKNRHLQTILPSMFRRVTLPPYQRERITTPDDDFIDLDWLYQTKSKPNKVVIIGHGLEGDASRPYVKGMARTFFQNGWDVCAYNYRGCSGENNRQLRGYHSGATDDLQTVIDVVTAKEYSDISLIGFSLGGNLVLKYAGELGTSIASNIKKVVAIAAPCHLSSGSKRLHESYNSVYLRRFMRKLRVKVVLKKDHIIKAGLDYERLVKSTTFREFDDLFSGPAHGFKDGEDYYEKCSARQFMPNIAVPTFLLSSTDDPFLTPECFPIEEATNNPYFFLEMPSFGGHMGFLTFGQKGRFWTEQRALDFIIKN